MIGVAFDGTGYGTDGAIWGGEFLVAGYAGFERRAHLRYVPLAGGDAAVRQPWRVRTGLLMDRSIRKAFREHRSSACVRRMIEIGLNTVQTSSCGRLFDAVAALIGLRHEVNFEGQAAIELEAIADPSVDTRYEFLLTGEELDFRPAIESISRSQEPRPVIAARFHNTVADAIVHTCRQIGMPRVCLSGGTFQNIKLLSRTVPALRRAGFEVYLHEKVPPNDGGIALGQAAIAAATHPA